MTLNYIFCKQICEHAKLHTFPGNHKDAGFYYSRTGGHTTTIDETEEVCPRAPERLQVRASEGKAGLLLEACHEANLARILQYAIGNMVVPCMYTLRGMPIFVLMR
jgi:hypothetical protein